MRRQKKEMDEPIYVPKGIGICVDGFGFMGLLDLRVSRSKYGPKEFLGLVKDRASGAYLVDYNNNENTQGKEFFLKKVESTHPAGVYYVTDYGRLDRIGELEAYVLYLDDTTYCGFDVSTSAAALPGIRCGTKRWKEYYEVVKAVE